MEKLSRLDRIRHQGNLYGFSVKKGGVTLWRCLPLYRKCCATLRCDRILKTIIEQRHRHNHPPSFDYNAPDGSYQATVEENITERRKHPRLISAAETASNETINSCSTNSESGPRYNTEGMPCLAPAIAHPSCYGNRPKQFDFYGTKLSSSETSDITLNASLIPETSNFGSVSSFCSTELPAIQTHQCEIASTQPHFSGAVEAKAKRNIALEKSQQPGPSSSSFQGQSVDDLQIIGVMPAWRNQFRGMISSHHQAQANVPVGYPAMIAEFPNGTKLNFMGSFLCIECHQGRTPCIICPKYTMCRMCCKH